MKNFYQHHNVHILSHLVKLNSKTVHIKENHVWDCLKPHTTQIRGKNHHRLHVFGNGREIFDVLKYQSCDTPLFIRLLFFYTFLFRPVVCHYPRIKGEFNGLMLSMTKQRSQ